MKNPKDFQFKQEDLTQTLPSDLAQRAKLAAMEGDSSQEDSNDNNRIDQFGTFSYESNQSNKKTKAYEPRPLTPEDNIYEEVMAKVGSRPVKPKYWFEEFGDYWSCSCGHINKGEHCVGCGLSRKLLKSIFILHKPMDMQSDLSSKVIKNKERIDQETAYKESVDNRISNDSASDLEHIRPIETVEEEVPAENDNVQNELTYTVLDDQLPAPADSSQLVPVNPPTKPKRSKRPLIIALIIVGIIALSVGISAYVKYVAAPAQDYDKAVEAMKAGNYEQALDMFQSLGSYNDSIDMVRQCYIGMGQTHYEAGEFNDAIEDFETAQRYDETDDVKDSIRQCYIGIADRYQSKSKLNKAIEYYRKAQEINKTEDIREQIRTCFVGIGDKRLAAKDYDKAFEAYKKAQNIHETDTVRDKINDVKFAYLEDNISTRSDTVESYLNDLMDVNYPGVQSMYDEYYAWHVSIIANDSQDDFATNKTEFSRFDTVYFHTTLSGGKPDERIRLYYTVIWPDGGTETQALGDEWKSGSQITARFMYPMPIFSPEGDFTFVLYDSQSNEELSRCTVKFAN